LAELLVDHPVLWIRYGYPPQYFPKTPTILPERSARWPEGHFFKYSFSCDEEIVFWCELAVVHQA